MVNLDYIKPPIFLGRVNDQSAVVNKETALNDADSPKMGQTKAGQLQNSTITQ